MFKKKIFFFFFTFSLLGVTQNTGKVISGHNNLENPLSSANLNKNNQEALANPLTIPQSCQPAKLNPSGSGFIDPKNKCSFYMCVSDCAQRDKVCHSLHKESYFEKYGLKYCERFTKETYPKLSEEGKKWLNSTLACLQNTLFSQCNAQMRCTDCTSIRKIAFETHPYCYTSSGLCELSLADKWSITTAVDSSDLLTGESLVQVVCTGVKCLTSIFGSKKEFEAKAQSWAEGATYTSSEKKGALY